MIDTSKLPMSGSFVVAVLLYAGASVYAGQVVGARTIEKTRWTQACEAGLKQEVSRQRAVRTPPPSAQCSSLIGRWHPDLAKLCHQFGDPDFARPARQAEERTRALQEQRLARVAAGALDRCECARDVYLQERLIALGLYAGSARLVSLTPVSAMQGELRRNLNGPLCNGAES